MKITKDYVDRVYNELKDIYPGLTKRQVSTVLMFVNRNIVKLVKTGKIVIVKGQFRVYSHKMGFIKNQNQKNQKK